MFKITAIVSLMLIATWSHADSRRFKKEAALASNIGSGQSSVEACTLALKVSDCKGPHSHVKGYLPHVCGSTVWGTFSCDSCGNECVKACGTKHFRACCFNYLRKKRGPERVKFWTPNSLEVKMEPPYKAKVPFITFEAVPDVLTELAKDLEPNPFEDMADNKLNIYDV